MGGGVPATAVGLADGGCVHGLTAQYGVDQCGLAHAGGAREGDGLALGQQVADELHGGHIGAAVQQHAEVGKGTLRLPEPRFSIGGQIGLGQHDDGGHAARQRSGDVPLRPAQAEVLVQGHAHQQHVQVGGDQLPFAGGRVAHAAQGAAAFLDPLDDGVIRVAVPGQDSPVAHGGVIGGGGGSVHHFARYAGGQQPGVILGQANGVQVVGLGENDTGVRQWNAPFLIKRA